MYVFFPLSGFSIYLGEYISLDDSHLQGSQRTMCDILCYNLHKRQKYWLEKMEIIRNCLPNYLDMRSLELNKIEEPRLLFPALVLLSKTYSFHCQLHGRPWDRQFGGNGKLDRKAITMEHTTRGHQEGWTVCILGEQLWTSVKPESCPSDFLLKYQCPNLYCLNIPSWLI